MRVYQPKNACYHCILLQPSADAKEETQEQNQLNSTINKSSSVCPSLSPSPVCVKLEVWRAREPNKKSEPSSVDNMADSIRQLAQSRQEQKKKNEWGYSGKSFVAQIRAIPIALKRSMALIKLQQKKILRQALLF